jgi:hypothetical protein
MIVMLVSCKNNNIIRETSEPQIHPPEASVEQIPEAPVEQIPEAPVEKMPVTKVTPENKPDLLFSSENYTERQDLKGLTLTNI